MANKTLIRNERPHEVTLGQGEQVAQSRKIDAQALDIPPPIARKTSARSRSQAPATKARADAPLQGSSDAGTTRRRKEPRAAGPQAAPTQAKTQLPARVPANRLWEDDSEVAQRLNDLLQRNARLAEQLQRLPSSVRSKGEQP